jgi:hypothetical protein
MAIQSSIDSDCGGPVWSYVIRQDRDGDKQAKQNGQPGKGGGFLRNGG